MEILRSDKGRYILELNSDEYEVLQLIFSNSDALKDFLIDSLLKK